MNCSLHNSIHIKWVFLTVTGKFTHTMMKIVCWKLMGTCCVSYWWFITKCGRSICGNGWLPYLSSKPCLAGQELFRTSRSVFELNQIISISCQTNMLNKALTYCFVQYANTCQRHTILYVMSQNKKYSCSMTRRVCFKSFFFCIYTYSKLQ